MEKSEKEKEEVTYEPGIPDPKMKWSVMALWNELLILGAVPSKVRNYIGASDIGKNFWERYQKMNGVPVTDPYDPRVLRVFAAGDEFHNLLKNVFKAMGLFIDSQDDAGMSEIEATATTLKVIGKYDIKAGGIPDLKKVREYCNVMGFSEFVKHKSLALAADIVSKHPLGLPEMIYEIKSINSQAFWNKKNYLRVAYPWHVYQLYIYLKANNIPEGRLLYVSKDDLVTQEHPVYYPDESLEAIVQSDIAIMSKYINEKMEPPKPPDMIFDEAKKLKFQRSKKSYFLTGIWRHNWEVERSQYFQLLTGMKTKVEWLKKVKAEIAVKNADIKEKFIKKHGIT